MKIFPITIFFLLNFLIIGVSGDKCTEKFKTFLEDSCQYLEYNSTNDCEFINNKCQIKPSCNAAGSNAQMCSSIKLTDNSKKCIIKNDVCTEETKTCTEYEKGKNICENLIAEESNKRCVLEKNDICKAHYNLCGDSNENQQTCEGNIPRDSSKKCKWDNGCKEVSKTCNEIDFNPDNCLDFKTSDDEKFNCVASIKGCKEQYKNCDLYNNNVNSNDKNKEDCESIIFIGTREKCIYDDENKICKKVNKECKDMLKDFCSDFTPSDTNKRCTRIGDNCEEILNTCELYDKLVGKNKEYCEKIIPYYTDRNELDNDSKCVFSSNSICERKKKSCSEITRDTICINHVLDDENKKCIYIYETKECKEVYKSCSNYKIKNREGCQGIILYKDDGYSINYNQICKYENDACSIKDLVQCSDYESRLDKEYCTSIHIGGNIYCAIKDNQCIEHFNSCPENANEETCNSKPLLSDTEKCIYTESSKCNKIKKECSEYKGKRKDTCENYLDAKDANKKCFMENGECVAKYIYCDKYKGNDKATCESIIPYNSEGNILKSNKCVMEGNKCIMKNKECSEAKTYKECYEIEPSDTNKNCIYLNGECKEQYKDCASYNSNGKESIEKDKCESILIMDYDFRFTKICVFTQGNTDAQNKCEEKKKVCTDFKAQNLQSWCYYISELTSTSIENKCAYFNSNCQEIKKTCLDLYDEIGATKEICEAAPTSDSNRKTCVLKEDESGCEEINKQNTNNSKFLVGDKKMINNLLLFIFILLV